MPPLQVQQIGRFAGTHEGVNIVTLPEIYSAGGSYNIWMDKFGRIQSIPGYTSVYSSGLGAGGTDVTCIYPFIKSDGTRHMIAAVDDDPTNPTTREIGVSTDGGATWTFYSKNMTATATQPTTDWSDFPFDSALFNGKLYFTNPKAGVGADGPFYWDGSAMKRNGVWVTDQSPTVTATAGSSGTGRLSGNYMVRLVSKLSDGTESKASAVSNIEQCSDSNIAYSWTADSDTNVVGYDVYRTTGNGKVYYFVDYVDGRTTTSYTDNVPDGVIETKKVLERHGDVPLQGVTFCEVFKQRMWWLRDEDNSKFYAYWSDVGDPESVYAENFLKFDDGPQHDDPTVGITGALGDFKDSLLVFTEGSIWRVTGTGRVINRVPDWSRELTNATTGTVADRSIVRVPEGARFIDQSGESVETSTETVAYFTPFGDIRLFDGDSDVIISTPMNDVLAAFNYATLSRHRINACHDRARQQIIWTFAVTGSSSPSKSVVWNYKHGVWFEWQNTPFFGIIEFSTTTDASVMYACGTGIHVYEFFTGTSFNGSAIASQWTSKPIFGALEEETRVQEATVNTKRWRWADLILEQDDTDGPPSLYWITGLGPGSETMTLTKQLSLPASGNMAQHRVRLQDTSGQYVHGEAIKLRLYRSSSNSDPWQLSGINLAYQILPGLKRRNQ